MTPAVPYWLITHGAAMVVAGTLSFLVTDLIHSAKADRLQAAVEQERAEAFRWVAAEQERAADAMAQADKQALERIAHENEEVERLRDCIERGTGCGLRVKVVRTPAQCGDVPETGTAAGLGDRSGEWAELSRSTSLDILALRSRLPVIEQALKLCVERYPR